MKPSKFYFLERIVAHINARTGPVRILELGAGTGEMARDILSRVSVPVEYVGIEPDPRSAERAREHIKAFPNAKLFNELGYGKDAHDELNTPFDFVYSLSVLEHVKDLPAFLSNATRHAATGAEVVHLYDLGHSLYPSSLKESIQTRLCGTPLLRFIPELKVARYLATEDVQRMLESTGLRVDEVTSHNTPMCVSALKNLDASDRDQLVPQVAALEVALSSRIKNVRSREHLFPSITFWCTKV